MNKDKRQSFISKLPSGSIYIALIILAGLIAYANSFKGPLQFDDNPVLGNAYKNFSNGGFSLFVPGAARWVVDVTFAANRYLHGYWLPGYHLVNLAVHIGSALSVYGLLRHILDVFLEAASDVREQFFFGRFIPFASALLFVTHPIQTEAVTYITQRYTSMAALFYLLALLFYLKARRAMILCPASGLFNKRHLLWWLLFASSAILAMKCKQNSITLPVMTAILEAVLFRGQLLKKVAFLVLLAILFAVIPIQEISSRNHEAGQSLSHIVRQVSTETESISRYSYFLTQQRVQATYLRLLLLPINQNLDYDYPVYNSIKQWPVAISLLLHMVLSGLALYFLIRTKQISGNHAGPSEIAMRTAGLGILWFYLALSVESSFIPIRDIIYEHRLYLPSVGFFMATMSGFSLLAIHRQWLQRYVWLMLAIVVLALTTATHLRNNVWRYELTMWQDVVDKSPDKARARANAGLFYAKRVMFQKAVENFVRAIEIEPGNDTTRIYLNHTLILISGLEKRVSSGSEYHLALETLNPDKIPLWRAISYSNMGLAYELLNNIEQAKKNYNHAVFVNPNLEIAWYNLALLAAKQNDLEGYNNAVLRLRQLNSEFLQWLGR